MSSSEINYLVVFDGHKSSSKPFGIQGAFPVQSIEFGGVNRKISGIGDTNSKLDVETSFFTAYTQSNVPDHINKDTANDMTATLDQLCTTKMKPEKITLYEVAPRNSGEGYTVVKKIEHDDALIGVSSKDHYCVRSDKAILTKRDPGKEEATNRTEIDYLNVQGG